ncbi:Crp/Fnr family transcriptional regulator [Actinoplanes sp. NPDC049599]|jgi:CRP-like cAMP-binding protein|uniref:Crp/Fnr family transcriptional regulator n=1 Tax=Actinoplanes sp. NPDC049599 TaxID=3363903 RepID=UPI0037B3E58F
MAALSVFDQLVVHPFLAGLPGEHLQRLAVHGRPVLRHTGYRLFREGGPADRFWLLRTGVVALDFHVAGRGDIVIERVGAGSVVGWSWLLPPNRWTLGAIVAEDCHAIEFDVAGVRRLLAEEPELGRELTTRFLAVMGSRLQASRHRLVELYAYPAH